MSQRTHGDNTFLRNFGTNEAHCTL